MALRISLNKLPALLCRDLCLLERSRLGRSINLAKPCFFRSSYITTGNIKLPVSGVESENVSRRAETGTEESVYKAKNDPDVFGQSAFHKSDHVLDPGDIKEEDFIQNRPRNSQRLRVLDYARMIKDCLNEKKIKEAIDILEIRMLKEDRVKPTKYIYNLLISGCARAGYSKKAFQLYNKMKQRGLPVTAGTYTSLFNACSNDPWPQVGLNRANRLREIMLEKAYSPNAKNYNAMIKAYGRCGDIKLAFQLADEMLDKGLQITTETFNFLLQACASDEEFGFRHALITWHKMLRKGLVPDLHSFNLMLRCTRDCSIGDVKTMEEVISHILSSRTASPEAINETRDLPACDTQHAPKFSQISDGVKEQKDLPPNEKIRNTNSFDFNDANVSQIDDVSTVATKSEESVVFTENVDKPSRTTDLNSKSLTQVTVEWKDLQTPLVVDTAPNLISNNPHLGSLVSIGEVINSTDRFLLLGGISGFLNEMKMAGVTPGIETFTAMVEVIPSTRAAEKQIIAMIRKIGLKADIDFFNVLIKKRSMRFDYDGAKEVLSMIKTAKLNPDIVTYGVLALGCQTQEDARELLNEMRNKGIRMNIQILGAMLRQGCCQKNFAYVHEIMQIVLEEKVKPNEDFLKHLDNFYKQNKRLIENKHRLARSKTFRHNFNNFESKLNTWQAEFGIENLTLQDAIKKLKENPYKVLKEDESEGFEEIKNEKLARKQKLRKYIKKIKVKYLKDDDNIESTTQ